MKSIDLRGGEEDEGNMPSTGTSGPMAVKRPDGAGGIGAGDVVGRPWLNDRSSRMRRKEKQMGKMTRGKRA